MHDENEPWLFDRVDMRNHYNKGYWHGAIASGVTILVVCFLLGLLTL